KPLKTDCVPKFMPVPKARCLNFRTQWLPDVFSSFGVNLKYLTMRKIILIILTCVVASCSATKGIMDTDNNMKKISVGMTKKKVISILGDDYEITSSKDRTLILDIKVPTTEYIGLSSLMIS